MSILQKENEQTRSEKLQKQVGNVLGTYFDDVASLNTADAMEDERVKIASKDLEDAKIASYYDNDMCVMDAKHIASKVFRIWAIANGCKWDNKKQDWDGLPVKIVWTYVFDENDCPIKGIIKDGTVKDVSLTLVNTKARAASWLAWIDDVLNALSTSVKKRITPVTKAKKYIVQAHKFLKLSECVKRAAKVTKMNEDDLRKYYFAEIRKARQAHKAKLIAEANKAKNKTNKK